MTAKFEDKKALVEAIVSDMQSRYGSDNIQLSLEDSYYNMREVLENHMEVVELAKKAIENVGLEPVIEPVRGGTDGSRLSFMGLPTPNLLLVERTFMVNMNLRFWKQWNYHLKLLLKSLN